MVAYKGKLTIPQVLPEICIGCGSCQYICPAEPRKAMVVTGLAVQTEIPDPATVLKKQSQKKSAPADFPF
jgi:Fe-S-cluster-containing hydrogenase component 2